MKIFVNNLEYKSRFPGEKFKKEVKRSNEFGKALKRNVES
jgi:hypothetical protein